MERRSFRQWGQLMVGAVLAALAVGIAWAMLGGWVARSAMGVAWCVALMVLSYVVFVRPCVVVDEAGVEVRNILRDVRLPWAVVTGARPSWSLVVDTAHASHSAWAIAGTASPGRDALVRRVRRNAGPIETAALERYPIRSDADAVESGLTPSAVGSSAAAIAALVRRRGGQGVGAARHAGDPAGGYAAGGVVAPPVPTGTDVGATEPRPHVVWSSVALLVLVALAVPLATLL